MTTRIKQQPPPPPQQQTEHDLEQLRLDLEDHKRRMAQAGALLAAWEARETALAEARSAVKQLTSDSRQAQATYHEFMRAQFRPLPLFDHRPMAEEGNGEPPPDDVPLLGVPAASASSSAFPADDPKFGPAPYKCPVCGGPRQFPGPCPGCEPKKPASTSSSSTAAAEKEPESEDLAGLFVSPEAVEDSYVGSRLPGAKRPPAVDPVLIDGRPYVAWGYGPPSKDSPGVAYLLPLVTPEQWAAENPDRPLRPADDGGRDYAGRVVLWRKKQYVILGKAHQRQVKWTAPPKKPEAAARPAFDAEAAWRVLDTRLLLAHPAFTRQGDVCNEANRLLKIARESALGCEDAAAFEAVEKGLLRSLDALLTTKGGPVPAAAAATGPPSSPIPEKKPQAKAAQSPSPPPSRADAPHVRRCRVCATPEMVRNFLDHTLCAGCEGFAYLGHRAFEAGGVECAASAWQHPDGRVTLRALPGGLGNWHEDAPVPLKPYSPSETQLLEALGERFGRAFDAVEISAAEDDDEGTVVIELTPTAKQKQEEEESVPSYVQEAMLRHPGVLLVFRMGKDAGDVHRLAHPAHRTAVLGHGVPDEFSGSDLAVHFRTLIGKGHRVALVEQVEAAVSIGKTVERVVTPIVTPAAADEDDKDNYSNSNPPSVGGGNNREIGVVEVAPDARGRLVMNAAGEYRLLIPPGFGSWDRDDLSIEDQRPTLQEIEDACTTAAAVVLTGAEWDDWPDGPDGCNQFWLRCAPEDHPERWRLAQLREVLTTKWANLLQRAGMDRLGELAAYLESGRKLENVKGITAKQVEGHGGLLHCLRDSWAKGTAEGQRGEWPEWLGPPGEEFTPLPAAETKPKQTKKKAAAAAEHPCPECRAEMTARAGGFWCRECGHGGYDASLRECQGGAEYPSQPVEEWPRNRKPPEEASPPAAAAASAVPPPAPAPPPKKTAAPQPPPKSDRPGRIAFALREALHQAAGAKDRWAGLVRDGAPDVVLESAIADQFAWCGAGGIRRPGEDGLYWFAGASGKDRKPYLFVDDVPLPGKKPTLEGDELLLAVRNLMGVGLPEGDDAGTGVKAVLTTGEVAKLCKVAPRTVSKWFDSGKLKGYRIPGSNDRRIPREQLVRFLEDNGMPPLPAEPVVAAATAATTTTGQEEASKALPGDGTLFGDTTLTPTAQKEGA